MGRGGSEQFKAATSKAGRRQGYKKGKPFPVVSTDVDPKIYDLGNLEKSGWVELGNYLNQRRQAFERGDYNPQPARLPNDDEVRIVIADIHGNYRNLYRLLLAAGALNRDGSRNPGFHVTQVGDLLHLGHDTWEADQDTSLIGPDWIDCQLIGNHELPFIQKRVESTFAGMHYQLEPGISQRLNTNMRAGHYRAVAAIDGWLISHAGADPRLLRDQKLIHTPEDLDLLAERLEDLWIGRLTGSEDENPLTDWVGYHRGGNRHTGSLFWCSYPELMKGYNKMHGLQGQLQQIVGHTPRDRQPRNRNGIWNIDLVGVDTGFVSALIKTKDQEDWQLNVLQRTVRPQSTIGKQVLPKDLR